MNTKRRKSLTVNDLGGPAPRKHLMVNDLDLSSLNCKKQLVINPESVIMVVMKETIEVLISRDGLSKAEATEQVLTFLKSMTAGVEEGDSVSLWENQFVEEFGLEPDYFEDFAFRLA